VPEGLAHPYLDDNRLKLVLKDWCPTFPGYHLYYPSRRQSSRALAVLIEALRLPALTPACGVAGEAGQLAGTRHGFVA
jgi:DNA-binding transcriptional LysR family regulator